MIGNNFVDEIDCGSFFDQIDDLLDFPVEDVDAGLPPAKGGDSANSFPTIWPTHSESLHGSDSVFSSNSNSDLSAELSVPYEDIVQLEWLSNFVEDSFCGGSLTMNKEERKDLTHNQFQTSSPVSVLESSSSCSSDKSLQPRSPEPTVATPGHQRGRARSKRPRPATFSPRPPIQLISPASSVSETNTPDQALQLVPKAAPSDTENFAESRPLIKIPKHGAASGMQKIKNKKIKLSFSLATPSEAGNQNSPSTQSVRKCMHCEITKTPQWRAGPMGPKTLCNACGVRYKSGRLFPEYRPAASPTFIPSLHSNSHKKVLEMRNKIDENTAAITISVQPELIPNTNSAISMDYI
ncbi:GATA transcription factor 8-like [Benincasa hispida]|uniref:GATA transcription factor 8-like n=1 Tax=Benincasa hispida TaxID=102211 RepID=UPI0019017770|nr:GATA transcription factor 8-like [Benincasa hispida]XP_038892636.1 GATA transcription factor 8-like [Benincasa hispida]XP_038892637.1 GATA transcription factor 8-like [Benincasa hispida]